MENPEPDWAGITRYVLGGMNIQDDRDVTREEIYEEDMWMGSDSDFSDHALGIDY